MQPIRWPASTSVHVDRNHVHDSHNHQHHEQRQVQDMPGGEQVLAGLELRNAPGGHQSRLDVTARRLGEAHVLGLQGFRPCRGHRDRVPRDAPDAARLPALANGGNDGTDQERRKIGERRRLTERKDEICVGLIQVE